MKRNIFLLTSLLMVTVLFAACAPMGEASAESAVEDLGSLSKTLRDAGATVESNETIRQGFFTVEGRILKVNGADVQAFESKSAEVMEAEADHHQEMQADRYREGRGQGAGHRIPFRLPGPACKP